MEDDNNASYFSISPEERGERSGFNTCPTGQFFCPNVIYMNSGCCVVGKEICKHGRCELNECKPSCSENAVCCNGLCCSENEKCEGGQCTSKSQCSPKCSKDESCCYGTCCTQSEICVNGGCQSPQSCSSPTYSCGKDTGLGCYRACTSNADCVDGNCNSTTELCETGRCLPIISTACTENSDCPGGYDCSDKNCIPSTLIYTCDPSNENTCSTQCVTNGFVKGCCSASSITVQLAGDSNSFSIVCCETDPCGEGLCCDKGHPCINGSCCNPMQACGTTCCPTGQVCYNGSCVTVNCGTGYCPSDYAICLFDKVCIPCLSPYEIDNGLCVLH